MSSGTGSVRISGSSLGAAAGLRSGSTSSPGPADAGPDRRSRTRSLCSGTDGSGFRVPGSELRARGSDQKVREVIRMEEKHLETLEGSGRAAQPRQRLLKGTRATAGFQPFPPVQMSVN